MNLIDTHAHLYLPEFDADRVALLNRALTEGIGRILMPAIDTSTHEAMLNLESSYPETCIAMMGLHPCSVKQDYKEELKIARQHLENRTFCAVGEMGLDFYWDKTYTAEQYQAFHEQIEWALHFNIPVVIHSRNAVDECLEVVAEHQEGKLRGVLHCFSGTATQAQRAADLGFFLGIGGVVTFKNSGLDAVMKEVPLDVVVLETDAPYLAPVPHRGRRNEPSYLTHVVKKLAGLKGCSIAELANKTTSNAEKLFGV